MQVRCYDQDCRSKRHGKNSQYVIYTDALPESIKHEFNNVVNSHKISLGTSSESSSESVLAPSALSLSTEFKERIMVNAARDAFGNDHPEMIWDVSSSTYDVMNGWRLPLSSRYCPKCKQEHETAEAYIQCNQQGWLSVVCPSSNSMLTPISVPKNVGSVLFINYINNAVVNNYNGANGSELSNPRDFGDFEDFPLDLFANADVARSCYDSLEGDTTSMSEFLRQMIKDKFIFVDGQWYKYNSVLWESQQRAPNMFLSRNVAPIYKELEKTFNKNNQVKWLQNIAWDLKNSNRRKPYMEELENNLVEEEPIVLNASPNILGFENGIFDTEAMEFRSHMSSDYITTVLPYELPSESNENIRKQIMAFFESIIPNEAVRIFLLSFLAIHLEGKNRHQMAVIFTGTGSNGKGILKALMKETFGHLHDEPSAALLTSERPSDESPCPNLVRLASKRSVFMSEPEHGKKINGSFLKFLTGRDTINVRNLNSKEYVQFIPAFTPTLLCNSIPKIEGGADDINGIWRRLKIINFPVQFSLTGPYSEFRKPIDDSLEEKKKSTKMSKMKN
ncbi:hypothetical protein BDK51DRAFT_47886 [Blyttiomyces helicus]|uniref:SF3 helicase domain-containing protein n=1 Tax=Blyttiomyces helicus TaxID=388810 RepID=A0A4P9WKN1_9FUNG|nr:hypothetical protein BDK51DRAFT_47886 [Blyttiomyces helicus]|eukprot:RKO93559.1 hypothetical protein BDK51DRAFT_47886 [Blyttiomyces helicus]